MEKIQESIWSQDAPEPNQTDENSIFSSAQHLNNYTSHSLWFSGSHSYYFPSSTFKKLFPSSNKTHSSLWSLSALSLAERAHRMTLFSQVAIHQLQSVSFLLANCLPFMTFPAFCSVNHPCDYPTESSKDHFSLSYGTTILIRVSSALNTAQGSPRGLCTLFWQELTKIQNHKTLQLLP